MLTTEILNQLAGELGAALSRLNAQVATAESCTGGGIAEAITRAPGSSAWFELGLVTYSNAQKGARLGVPAELLAEYGAVSEPVVAAMLRGVQRLSGARFAIAVSGVAGPSGGTRRKPVGTVCIGLADGENIHTHTRYVDGTREQIRLHTVCAALRGCINFIQSAAV